MPSTNLDYDYEYDQEQTGYDHDTFSDTNVFYVPKKKRLYYPTTLRSRIVNAKTGHAYPYLQGSYEELQLFKIIDSTARCDGCGFLQTRQDPVNRDPIFLYYDNPEQCMRHMRITFSPERIRVWRENHKRMFPEKQGFNKMEWDLIKQNK